MAAILKAMQQKLVAEFDAARTMTPDGQKEMLKRVNDLCREAGIPGYEKKKRSTNKRTTGNPKYFADFLKYPDDLLRLKELLRSMNGHEYAFVSVPVEEFCGLLQLPDALNSYAYLDEEGLKDGYIRFQPASL